MDKIDKRIKKINQLENVRDNITRTQHKNADKYYVDDSKDRSKYIFSIIEKYKKYRKLGKNNNNNIIKYLYFSFSLFYLGHYFTNYYREFDYDGFVNKYKNGKYNFNNNKKDIIRDRIYLSRLVIKYKPTNIAVKSFLLPVKSKVNAKDIEEYIQSNILSNIFNYAHLLFYVNRILPSIHISLRLYKHLRDTSNKDILYYKNILYLLMCEILQYLYEYNDLSNSYALSKLKTYENSLNQYNLICNGTKDPFLVYANQFNCVINEIKRHNQLNNIKPKNYGKYSLCSRLFNKYKKWSYKNCLNLNFNNDLGGEFYDRSLPSKYPFNERLIKNLLNTIKNEYKVSRYRYYLSLNDSYNYTYKSELMKSSFELSYSVIDKVLLIITTYLNNKYKEDSKFKEHIIRDTYNGKDKNDYLTTYFYKFFSNKCGSRSKKVRKILKEDFSHNDALKGLYWIAQDLGSPKNGINDKLYLCRKLRNAIEHRCLCVQKHNLGYKEIKDTFNKNSGIILIGYKNFQTMLDYLLHICREIVMLTHCFLNIGTRNISKLESDELK